MSTTRKLVVTALLIALCVVLPMAFHIIPYGLAGRALLPMHIPVLLAGLVVGWKYGLIVGITGPLLSSVLTGMPPMGIAVPMMVELGVYGLVAGVMIEIIRTKRASLDLYICLIIAMLAGRVVAGIAQAFYFFEGAYTWELWTSAYFVTALPGLVIQLAFIPSVVMALERERFIPLRYPIETPTPVEA